MPLQNPEQLEEVCPGVDAGGRGDVVPADVLRVVSAEPIELEVGRVEVGSEEQERHRADAHRVVAAGDGVGCGRIQVFERLPAPVRTYHEKSHSVIVSFSGRWAGIGTGT